jgi:ADP-heptose:LPS heptosyltransferase
VHRIDYYLHILEKAGLRIEDRHLDFYFSDEDARLVDEFLHKNGVKKHDFLIALNPGGNWLPKRWPKESWAFFADKLIADLQAKVIITGSASDRTLGDQIKSLMKEKPIIACGLLNIKQLGALCKRLDVFVTADTGPMHIANAVGTKQIIALFGPTSPDITGPFPVKNVIILRKDIGCAIPCYQVHCKNNRCMKAITPEDVLKYIKL